MTSATSNVAFGNAYSSVQAKTINGSVYIGTSRGRLWAVRLSKGRSGALSRHLKQDPTTPSVVYQTPKTRPSTRSRSSTSLSASPTRASLSLMRYTAGRRDKTSDASSGCVAWRAQASRPSRGPSRASTMTSSVWRPASSSRVAAETLATQASLSRASQCSL
jgi:hypothetical protein